MFNDFETYFYEHVVRSFEEYLDVRDSGKVGRSRDIRAAVNAATPLYHLREHLPAGHTLTHAAVAVACPDYSLLGDMVNASKHFLLTKGTPKVADATQIQERVVTTQYEDVQGLYHWHDKVVIVRLKDGSERDVLEVVINVMNFWQSYLHSIGIVRKARRYSLPSVVQPRSRLECGNAPLNFEAVQGLPFHQRFRLQKYNYGSGKIEPLDLAGSHLRFTIYKPGFELNLVLKNESLGKEFRKMVILSEKESVELSLLQTEREKQTYLDGLASVQEALHQLATEAGLSKKEANKPIDSSPR